MGTLFSDETWKSLSGTIASSFSMDAAKAGRLAASPVAKLIAAIPYVAGCREARRSALAHLGTYVIAASAAGREAFDHAPGDDYDLMARLATGANFEGGDPAIIARGMKLLAMVMIHGYIRDVAADQAAGRYNPVAKGAWDGKARMDALRSEIATTAYPELDSILPVKWNGVFWET